MLRVFRLVRSKFAKPAELLSGTGAASVGGRWNEKGTRLLYAASHVSLVILEALVHATTLPSDMVLVAIDLPESSVMGRWRAQTLPRDWADYPFPTSTQKLGTAWTRTGRELGVWVPSVVVPSEWNCLINPAHAGIARVKVKVLGPLAFDSRLRRPRR